MSVSQGCGSTRCDGKPFGKVITVRINAVSAFQGVRIEGFHCIIMLSVKQGFVQSADCSAAQSMDLCFT